MTTDLITDKALEIVNTLQNTLMTHGGEAVQLGLATVRITCISYLMSSFIAMIGGVLLFVASGNFYKKYKKDKFDDTNITLSIICFLIGCLFILPAIGGFGYIWNWVGIFDPKLYLAHQVIGKVVG